MIATLSTKDLRKFIKFCSEDRGTGDFEIHFGLSRTEVETLKASLGIDSPADARNLIKDVIIFQEKEEALRAAERQAILNEARAAAQKRLDAAILKKQADKEQKKHRVLSVTKIKNQDKKRQQKFDKQHENTRKIKSNSWRLPEDVEADDFAREIRVRGIRFICDKYNISRSDVMSEVARLKLKINFDLVPR